MNKTNIDYKGSSYRREVEMLGEVEMVKWYQTKMSGFSEIYDHELSTSLEEAYEASIIHSITPALSII